MYKEELALNNLQWLICHKTKPNQSQFSLVISTIKGFYLLIYLLERTVNKYFSVSNFLTIKN